MLLCWEGKSNFCSFCSMKRKNEHQGPQNQRTFSSRESQAPGCVFALLSESLELGFRGPHHVAFNSSYHFHQLWDFPDWNLCHQKNIYFTLYIPYIKFKKIKIYYKIEKIFQLTLVISFHVIYISIYIYILIGKILSGLLVVRFLCLPL